VARDTLTYRQLDALLDRLGFTRQVVERREPGTRDPGGRKVYETALHQGIVDRGPVLPARKGGIWRPVS
jgi:hypothetical protein